MTRELRLRQHTFALVDDADYAPLAAWKWTYLPNGRSGYAVRWERRAGVRRTIYLHRQIMDAAPGQLVDHINGDGLDNRRANLRLCGQSHNLANRPAPARTIPYRGVYAARRSQRVPWKAQIKAFQRNWHLGQFATMEDAARAYDRAALHFFGSFARLNFPDDQDATRCLPLAPCVARLAARDTAPLAEQLALPLDFDDLPPPPVRGMDGYEAWMLGQMRAARVRLAPTELPDDWDAGLL